jgi:hypothetical protein
MGRVPKGGKFIKVPYQRPWVKAVIFGCRMNTDAKNYIRKALPFNVEFKQATETIDHIEIVAFDEALHL